MSLRTLIKDAYGILVYHCKAGIAPGIALVYEQATWPGETAVHTYLDCHVTPVFSVCGIGEDKHVPRLYDTCHTNRARQGSIRGMRLPVSAKITRHVNCTACFAVVPHIEHENAGLHLHHLGFRGVYLCILVHLPGEAAVTGIHDAGRRGAVRFLVLERHHQGTVFHGYTASGALESESPGLLLDLACKVFRLAPGNAVVL